MFSWFHNLRLKWKVLLAPAFLIATLVAVGSYALAMQWSSQAAVGALMDGPVLQAEIVGDFNTEVWAVHARLYRLTATAANESDEKKIKAVAGESSNGLAALVEKLKAFDSITSTDTKTVEYLDKLKTAVANYIKQAKSVVDMAQSDAGAALMFMTGAERRFVEIEKLSNEITAISKELRASQTASANASLDRQQTVLIGVMALAVLIGCIVSLLVSGGIARPVVSIADAIKQIARGDLDVAVPSTGQRDEIGIITDAAIALREGLQDTVRAIASLSREVASAAVEISGSTTDLSQRTEEQAASLEETAASMEEITTTVRTNAENAQQASKLTADSCTIADRSGAIVTQAVQAMSRIEQSSTKIADIIGVIDEIARQTNLLALNAAVEAARAGDAGRGFAVVAVEVRSLSQRSAQAAKDITDLIVNSSTQVKEGVELVNQAGKSLHEIIGSIKQVAAIVAGIASTSAKQATGLEQVSNALLQMDQMTQQNSALVEQNAATATMLEERAHAMNERVGFFQFDDQPAPQPSEGKTVQRAAA